MSELAGAAPHVGVSKRPVPDAAAPPAKRRRAPQEEPAPEREAHAEPETPENLRRSLRFRVHEGTGRMFAQIVDPSSGEVVRNVPPEEMLRVLVRVHEMVGVFLDRQG